MKPQMYCRCNIEILGKFSQKKLRRKLTEMDIHILKIRKDDLVTTIECISLHEIKFKNISAALEEIPRLPMSIIDIHTIPMCTA